MPTTNQKLMGTLISVIVFIIISLPTTYKVTNSILGEAVGSLANTEGSPTMYGIVVHSIVFGIIIFILMGLKLNVN
jgi:hypothetical protein